MRMQKQVYSLRQQNDHFEMKHAAKIAGTNPQIKECIDLKL